MLQVANSSSNKNPLAAARGKHTSVASLVRTAAQYIRGQKALGTLHEFIFHGFALVESSVAIFLDSGKVDKDVLSGRALNEAIAFGSVEPLNSSLLFHKCNSFRLSFRLKSPPLNCEGGEKRLLLCRPDSSFPQPMAAVPEGPKATPATGSFGEFKLLYKNINQNAPCGMYRREQGIIFRNSGPCKALCLHRPATPKGTSFTRLSFR